MPEWSTILSRTAEGVQYYAGGTWRLLNTRQVHLWAQAVAFKVLVTIVPVVILATGVLGLILKGEEAFTNVAAVIRNFIPGYQSRQLIDFLNTLQRSGGAITVIGGVGLLYSVMTLFSTLRVVVSNAFQEEWHRQRGILQGYLFDIRMAVQVGLLFLLTMGLSVALQALNASGDLFLAEQGLRWIRQGWGSLFQMVGLFLPLAVTVLMFFQLFFFVPRPRPPIHSALAGALVTSVLWEVAKYAFTFYATRVGQFSYGMNGTGKGLGALAGSFGLLIAFVLWVYYSGLVLTIGAFVGLLSEKRARSQKKHKHLNRLKKQHAIP